MTEKRVPTTASIKAYIQAGSHQSGLAANKPATCSPGDVYHATDTEIYYVCFVANTWSGVGGAVGSKQVRLPDPEAGDFVTPGVHDKSSEGVTAPIENASQNSSWGLGLDNWYRMAQRITLAGATLQQVSWWCKRRESPTGTMYARIRRVSDDGIIETSSKTVNVATLSDVEHWEDFPFTCAPNEEVYISLEYSDGGDGNNFVSVYYLDNNVISGKYNYWRDGYDWCDPDDYDMTIKIQLAPGPIINTSNNTSDLIFGTGNDYNRAGQKITLSGDTLTKARCYIGRWGSPTGTVYCRVRRVSDDGIIETSPVTVDASTLSVPIWVDFPFTCAPNEEVRIAVEFSGGDADNTARVYYLESDVISGCYTRYRAGAWNQWFDLATDDTTIEIHFAPNEAANSVDDDTDTYWMPDPPNEVGAWISWDIGSLKFTGGCRIYWGNEAAYRPTEYKIYTSPDDLTWTEVIHETEAAPASAWKTYNWYVQKAQYIKIVVTTHGASGTKVYEVDGYSSDQDDVILTHGHGELN